MEVQRRDRLSESDTPHVRYREPKENAPPTWPLALRDLVFPVP
jgi:hypothetical protein